jgi:hypothetical protein
MESKNDLCCSIKCYDDYKNYRKKRNEYYRKKRLEDISKTRMEEKEYMRQYNSSPKRIYQILIDNAKKRNSTIEVSLIDFVHWWYATQDKCFYCKRTLVEINRDNINTRYVSRLTVDRVDNNIGYHIKNIVKCCWLCNRIKSNDFNKEEMLKIGLVINEIKRVNHE